MNCFSRWVRPILLGLLLVLCHGNMDASHAMGADLEYVCLGGNTYEFTFAFYRDCDGITAPTSISLTLNSPSCGAAATVLLNQQGAGTEVSPLCAAQVANSSCNGGTLPGVEQYLFTGTYTFTQNCPDWTVSWTTCCRNALITNLVNPSSEGMYIFADLDNTGGMCNSSPSFTTLPVPFICDGQQFCYNHGAVDPDGDSLAYSLINALDGPYPGIPLGYAAPNSPTYPVTTLNGTVSFDPLSGTMCITPNGPQVAVVAIQVDEFRNGVRIGRTMRDIQVVVRTCTNEQPVLGNNGIFNSVGGVQTDSNSVETCPGDPISFNLLFMDANAADNINVLTNLAAVLPGANFTTMGNNPVTGNFSWTPTATDIGFHNFTVTIQDDGCPILGSQVFSFDIQVLGGTYAGPDQNYCPSGSPVPLSVNGGSMFTWSTISGDPSGLSCNNCPNPIGTPSVSSVYEVVSNLSGTCRNRDTIAIILVPDFSIDAGPDASTCKYGTVPLNGSLGPVASAPFTFAWTPSDSLSNPSSLSPQANPENTTTYYLTATSALGCTLFDSVTVDISGVAPLVLLPPADTICPGTPVPMNPIVTFECDTTGAACSGPVGQGTISSGTSSTSTYGPGYMVTTTAYTIRRQYIFTAAEMNAMGFSGGRIQSLGVNFTNAGSAINTLRISLGCTDETDFDTAPYFFFNNLTEVKSPGTVNPVIGWNDIPFDHGYSWDGISNLVVEFCTDNTNLGTSSSTEYGCLTARFPTLYLNYAGAGACAIASGTRTGCRPNMRFGFCEAIPSGMTFLWTPNADLNNANILNPIASPATNTNLQLEVDDGSGCLGNGFTSLVIDSSVYVSAVADDPTPCGGQMVTLNSSVTGQALPPQLPNCGANNTSCSQSSTVYTVGNGTSNSSTYGPFYGGTSTDARYQFLFHATELQAAGVPSGTITELAWNILTKASTGPFENMRISLGCTNASDLSTGAGWLPTTLVFGPYDVTTAAGWNSLLLDNTFDWDGNSNLVVEVCYNNPNNGAVPSDAVAYANGVGFTATMRNYASVNNADGCALAPSFTYTSRGNMQFTVCPPPPNPLSYSWSPSTGMTTPNAASTTLPYTGPMVYTLTVSGGRCPVTDTVALQNCGILPADALQLFGEAEGSFSKLRWATQNEVGSSHFVLERSADGRVYESLARVEAAGHSSGEKVYFSDDLHPEPARNFYRVRMLDMNGQEQHSNTVELWFGEKTGFISLYPNPVKGGSGMRLKYWANESGPLELVWMDALGRMVRQKSLATVAGMNQFELSTEALAEGVYFVRVKCEGQVETRKVVLQR